MESELEQDLKGPCVIDEVEAASKTALLSGDIIEFKEKLLKESKSRHQKSNTNLLSEIESCQIMGPPTPDWLHKRPYLSLNFVLSEVDKGLIGALGEVAVSTQEHHLLDDLLHLMIGCQGTYITVSYQKEYPYLPSFTIDSSVEASVRALVTRILPLCSYYSQIVTLIEQKMEYYQGTVNQALSAALRNLLKDYLLLVTQLESQHLQGTLTLHRLWFYVEKTITLMEMLASISASVSKLRTHGGEVLSLLYEKMQSLMGCGQLQDVVIFLLEAASVPYMKMLNRWIYRGIIIDPYKEFMVVDSEGSHGDLSSNSFFCGNDLTDYYWEKRYSIEAGNVPTFLTSHADVILRTGKYLNVIRESGPNVICPDQEELIYNAKDKKYIEIIEKTYSFASKRLLELLMKEKDLTGHLKSVKHYFLLDQGDFVAQLLTLCESELSKNIDDVLPTRLESLLGLALRTSAAKMHLYKDSVHCTLLPYSLMSQMLQILSIETEDESDYRNPPERLHLSGFEGFSLTYSVEWPLSLILDCKSHFCYQMIFRHLFYCKYVERLLCRVWISNKEAKAFSLSSLSAYSQAFTLRQRMLNFIQNLEYYMNFEVIEKNWQNFFGKMKKVENIDELLVFHSDFLNGCMKDCMLTSPELLRILSKLTNTCLTFATFILSPESGDPVARPDACESFQQTIARLDLQFTGMLVTLVDRISEMGRENYNDALIHVVYRLDFSNFYSHQKGCLAVCLSPQNACDRVSEDTSG